MMTVSGHLTWVPIIPSLQGLMSDLLFNNIPFRPRHFVLDLFFSVSLYTFFISFYFCRPFFCLDVIFFFSYWVCQSGILPVSLVRPTLCLKDTVPQCRQVWILRRCPEFVLLMLYNLCLPLSSFHWTPLVGQHHLASVKKPVIQTGRLQSKRANAFYHYHFLQLKSKQQKKPPGPFN